MFRVKSLQQRLVLFLLLPVAALMVGMGIVGFFYIRNNMLEQWKEGAILKLQRAAHDVDMRLSRIKKLLDLYNQTGGEHFDQHTQEWILDQLGQLEGVAGVNLTRRDGESAADTAPVRSEHRIGRGSRGHMTGNRRGMMRFRGARIAEITPPRYDSHLEHETVSIISELIDANGKIIGRLEVVVRFDYLVENVGAAGWWQSHQAYLVDDQGKVLVSATPDEHQQLGAHNDPLELQILKALRESESGTVLGGRHSAIEVGGFYRLQEAPWNLIMFAPGKEILAPILRFRSYYIATESLFILLTLLLIRFVTARTVKPIKDVSTAAENIAQGKYSSLPPARSQDEVGQLISNFNTMVSQLQERMRLKKDLGLAMEVQQSLLPKTPPEIKGFDIAGKSIYCDETGGDYYDFIELAGLGEGRLGITVGDVAGHGIAPALIMTTVRSLLRSRATQSGNLAQMITDVNRLLCVDTSDTGNFMTLFFMLIDPEGKHVRWVRAGHEPAMVYDSSTDTFTELHGNGIALGVDETWSFEEQKHLAWANGRIILIGTDGIWETEDPRGERFGKHRVQEIIRDYSNRSSEEIVKAIVEALDNHRQTAPQQDDVTMVVIKSE